AQPAAVHAELPQRRGAAGGRVEPRRDPAARRHGAVRGRAAQGPVMDFARSDDERAFAEEVRGFLRAHPPERFALDGMDAGYGSGAHSREFMAALGGQGWLSMCWPRAHGGAERPMFHKLVLMEELALAGAPFGPLTGCWQTADAIIEYGTDRLRREVLPRI